MKKKPIACANNSIGKYVSRRCTGIELIISNKIKSMKGGFRKKQKKIINVRVNLVSSCISGNENDQLKLQNVMIGKSALIKITRSGLIKIVMLKKSLLMIGKIMVKVKIDILVNSVWVSTMIKDHSCLTLSEAIACVLLALFTKL